MEQKQAVHEAVCAERYKALNLKFAVIMSIQGVILLMLAGGSPVAAAIRHALSGGA